MTVDKLMSLLPSERRFVHLEPRRRGAYRSRKRTRLSKDELLEFLIANKVKTTGDLNKLRAQNKDCPLVQDFAQAFERFSIAVEQAHGKPILTQPPPNDPAYIAKIAVQFDCWSQAQYLRLRRMNPGVVPSSRQVRRIWGNFRNLFFAARKESARKTFSDYLKLEWRLGRVPTAMECRQAGLDLSPMRAIFYNKFGLDDFLDYRLKAEIPQAR